MATPNFSRTETCNPIGEHKKKIEITCWIERANPTMLIKPISVMKLSLKEVNNYQ